MIDQLNIYGKTKVEVAIDRMKSLEPAKGYWLAFSGGKDSCVLKALADMAGVKYEAHYSVTGIDPPELYRFIKTQHPDVIKDYPRYPDGKRKTMWNLIVKNKMPPTRTARYCCKELKESSGDGFVTLTGVRWAESNNRKTNNGITTIKTKSKKIKAEIGDQGIETQKGGIILMNDNTDKRKLVEHCAVKARVIVNPIIDWTTEEVWEFIHKYNVPYCELYDQGYTRLGCIGCPMSGKHKLEEFERYPKFKSLYLTAFKRMLENRRLLSEEGWETAEEVFERWVSK